MSKKYFFFDIDGTLTITLGNQTEIPESTRLALQKLEENGHFLAIATGRSYALSHHIMEDLGFRNMVSDGGNGVTINGKLMGIEPLNYQDCIDLYLECEEKGFPWGISPSDRIERLVPSPEFYEKSHDKYMPCVEVEGLDPRNYENIYKMYIACRAGEEEQIEALKKLPWCRFHDTYIFVEPTNKGNGIKKIVDYFGGDYKDVVVFGDQKNDLSMFLDEWTCIAMGNAVDELKEKADYVTTDIKDNGIYNACKKFGWIE